MGEVGELSEIFQWKGEVPKGLPDWKEEEKVHLGEELSDVLLYLVRLSDVCGVDLGKAALRKFELKAIKYPAKVCQRFQASRIKAPPPPKLLPIMAQALKLIDDMWFLCLAALRGWSG